MSSVQQLACARCGCLLAPIDTEVLHKCPACEAVFGEDVRPVLPSEAPKPGSVVIPEETVEPHGCMRFLFGGFATMSALGVFTDTQPLGLLLSSFQLLLWSAAFAVRPRQSWKALLIPTVCYLLLFLAIAWIIHILYPAAGA